MFYYILMGNLSSGSFADIYVDSALETITSNDLMKLGDFDTIIFKRVSEKTGLSEGQIKSMHHAFHWSLFNEPSSPFYLHYSGKAGDDWRIKPRNGSVPKKTDLINYVLGKYGVWLENRFQNLKRG